MREVVLVRPGHASGPDLLSSDVEGLTTALSVTTAKERRMKRAHPADDAVARAGETSEQDEAGRLCRPTDPASPLALLVRRPDQPGRPAFGVERAIDGDARPLGVRAAGLEEEEEGAEAERIADEGEGVERPAAGGPAAERAKLAEARVLFAVGLADDEDGEERLFGDAGPAKLGRARGAFRLWEVSFARIRLGAPARTPLRARSMRTLSSGEEMTA
jgi:hypothetical protein